LAITGKRGGTVHFVFCLEYMRAYYMRSADDGLTFSAPREITQAFEGFRANYDWKVLAAGPGHGIRLKNGRLPIPVWISTGTGGHADRRERGRRPPARSQERDGKGVLRPREELAGEPRD